MRWLLAPLALATLAPAAVAQALLKPHGESATPLILKTLRADIKITGPVATTTLTLRYANPHSQRIEADFLYQLPEGAVATAFAYWYGAEKVPARIAERERAAAIYKTITSRQRDPALVELVGKNKLRARIFPIEPNADLRIELAYVSALPRDRDGSALFTLPLTLDREAQELEECAAQVTVTGWPSLQNNVGQAFVDGVLHYSAPHSRPSKDLRVRVQGTRDSFVAAPSGGRDGFFALTSLQRDARLPPHSYALHRKPFGAGWLVTGRYHNAPQPPDPNGPAVKLWAAQELAALGKGARRQTVALSKRHGIVSAYTSWLAIPIAERRRYETEKREAALESATERLATAIRQNKPTEKLRQELARLCEGTDTTPGQRLAETFWETLTPLADRAVRGDQTARTMLLAQARRIGADSDYLLAQARRPVAHEELNETVQKLTPLFNAGQETSPEAIALRDTAKKLIEETHREEDNPLYALGGERIQQALARVAAAQLDNQPAPSEDLALLSRLTQFTGAPTATFLKATRASLAQDRLGKAQDRLREHVLRGAHDISQQHEEIRRLVHLNQLPNPEAEVRSRIEWALKDLQNRYLQAVANHSQDTKALAEQLKALEQNTGVHPSPNGVHNDTYYNLLSQLATLHYPLHPDRKAIAQQEAGLQRVERVLGITQRPPLPEIVLLDREEDPIRARLLAERRKLRPDPAKLQSLARQLETLTARNTSRDRAKTRVSLLLTDTELDLLERQPSPNPSRLATLRQRSRALHARFGDPLLAIDAPQDAQLVAAQLADGSVKPLAWSPEHQRWELRFDVPPHARPGAWDIQVTIVHADGHREGRVFPVTVDMDAPKAQCSLTQLPDGRVRLELTASPDARRATAFFDGAEPQSLTPTGRPSGFFTLLDARPRNLRVVVTDRAHNRTELTEFEWR